MGTKQLFGVLLIGVALILAWLMISGKLQAIIATISGATNPTGTLTGTSPSSTATAAPPTASTTAQAAAAGSPLSATAAYAAPAPVSPSDLSQNFSNTEQSMIIPSSMPAVGAPAITSLSSIYSPLSSTDSVLQVSNNPTTFSGVSAVGGGYPSGGLVTPTTLPTLPSFVSF